MQKQQFSTTPLEEQTALAHELGVTKLFFKREDLHPLGSHKGRSIPHMIDHHLRPGNTTGFAISGTGNASLAALRYCKQLNASRAASDAPLHLDILVGRNIAPDKLKRLEEEGRNLPFVSITPSDRPLQTLFVKTQDPSIKGLRQSTDPEALVGYASLAEELMTISDLRAVFIGTSSGTTAQALAEHFIQSKKSIEVHIVQTTSCHPMTDAFEPTPLTDEQSIADAIVDKIATRKTALTKAVQKTNGYGWVADNDRITQARELTSTYADLDISTNSALSVAGVMEAVYAGREWDGSVVCIICGQ